MEIKTQSPVGQPDVEPAKQIYRPPELRCLGSVAELTQKTVGGADGSTFMGLDIS